MKHLFKAALFSLLISVLAYVLWHPEGKAQVALAPVAKQQFFNNVGAPLSGGCVFTYAAGTSTLQATYTDGTGLTQNANPIPLDSTGRPTFNIFLSTQSYKFTVTNPPSSGSCGVSNFGSTLYTVDNISVPGLLVNNVTITSGNSLTLQPGSSTLIGTSLLPSSNAAYNLGGAAQAWNFGYIQSVVSNQTFTNSFQSFIGPNNFAGTTNFTGPITSTGVVNGGNIFAGLTSTDLNLSGSSGNFIAGPTGGTCCAAFNSITASTNASVMGFSAIAGQYASLYSSRTGGGTFLPLAFFTNAAQQMTLCAPTGCGGGVPAGVLLVGLTTSDMSLSPGAIVSANTVVSATGSANASIMGITAVSGLYGAVSSGRSGSGSFLPMAFFTNNVQNMTLDTSGNLTVPNGNITNATIKSTTGQRYVCVTTTGQLVSSASACSGT